VFEKVCCTVVFGGFVTGSSVDPYAYGSGFGSYYGFGCDAHAAVEGGDVGGGGTEDVVGEGGCFGAEGACSLGCPAVDSLVL